MKQKSLIVAAALVVVVAAGWVLFGRRAPKSAAMTQYKLAEAQMGSVRKTVSSTGTLQPWRTVDIKSKAGGRVLEMLVDVGTPVTKGQVIARIDPSDTQLAVNQAEADIASARARREQNARTYGLTVEQSRIAIATAEAALRSARGGQASAEARLETARRQAKVQPSLTAASVNQAQAALNQATKQRAQLDATHRQQRTSVQSAYDQALANQTNADSHLARQKSLLEKGYVSRQVVEDAEAQATVTRAQVNTARAKRDTLEAELSADVDAADARVSQARAALESAQANRADIANRADEVRQAEAALSQARAQVKQAEESLRQARANRANDEIRRLDISAAEATETRSRATLKNATDTLAQSTVRAPSEGVILTKYVDEGTIITSGLSLNSTGSSIVQLGDTTRMYVDVTVDETDIASVDEGQRVEISMDAYPGVPFEGFVARVDPQAVVEQNVTMIHVRVEVDNSTPTFRLLKPGMNATCDFIIDERDNVLVIPSSAVTPGNGGGTVQVASGGRPAPSDPESGPADPDALVGVTTEKRDVEIGLEGDENAEIVSGLKPGEKVVVQTIEPATAKEKGGSPFGGPPGRRR